MMTSDEARDLTHRYLQTWAPEHWKAGWRYRGEMNSIRTLGKTFYRAKAIKLSKTFLEQGTREQIIDTILHEVAHVIAGAGARHGVVWKAHARRLGCDPHAATHEVELEYEANYEATCAHGCTIRYQRRPAPRTVRSATCRPHHGKLVWMDNRTRMPLS